MTLSLLVRGLLRRELAPRALGSALVIAAAGGATLAIIAGRIDGARGIALLVVQGDRTLAGLFAIVSVFRVISRLSDDAGNAWPLQLIAAGSARPVYVAAVVLVVTLASLLYSVAGSWTFAAVSAATGGTPAAAVRAVATLPLVALMLFCASSFGAAVFCIAGTLAAPPIAAAIIVLPWFLMSIFAIGGVDALPLMVVRLASVPAPPLLVSPAVQDTGKLLIYAGVTFGLAIAASERRVARL